MMGDEISDFDLQVNLSGVRAMVAKAAELRAQLCASRGLTPSQACSVGCRTCGVIDASPARCEQCTGVHSADHFPDAGNMVDNEGGARLMKIYICGPITGIADENRPAFADAAQALLAAGYDVCNPHDIGDELARTMRSRKPTWTEYMKTDIPHMLQCEGVALLDGWEQSKGARVEVDLACALGIYFAPLAHWLSGEMK